MLSAEEQHAIEGSVDSMFSVDDIDIASTLSYASIFVGAPPCKSNIDCNIGEFSAEHTCNLSTESCSASQDYLKCSGRIDLELITDLYGKETS